jgi:hypothetical protein
MLLIVVPGAGDGPGRQPEELVAREDIVRERQAAVHHVRHVGQRRRLPHPSSVLGAALACTANIGAVVAAAVQEHLVQLRVLHEPLGGSLPREVVPLLRGQGLRVAGHGFLHLGHKVLRARVCQAVWEGSEELVGRVVRAYHELAHCQRLGGRGAEDVADARVYENLVPENRTGQVLKSTASHPLCIARMNVTF